MKTLHKIKDILPLTILAALLFALPAHAEDARQADEKATEEVQQDRAARREAMRERRQALREQRRAELLERFDTDGDGVLSDEERAVMRETLARERAERRQRLREAREGDEDTQRPRLRRDRDHRPRGDRPTRTRGEGRPNRNR